MKEVIADLQKLRDSMPISFTPYNIQQLKMKFSEYKALIVLLPGNCAPVKSYCERIFVFLKSKIEAIEDKRNSKWISRNIFQEVADQIKLQIDMVIGSIPVPAS